MDPKFAVDMRQYSTVKVECPDCGRTYQLRLRYDHSELAQKDNGLIKVRCPDCCKAQRHC
jgi:hypothetical protein